MGNSFKEMTYVKKRNQSVTKIQVQISYGNEFVKKPSIVNSTFDKNVISDIGFCSSLPLENEQI